MTATDDRQLWTGARPVDSALARMRAIVPGQAPGDAGTSEPDLVRAALAELPHDDQRLLWLKHVDRADDLAVAQHLRMPLGAVQRRLRQAERALSMSFAGVHARAAAGADGACQATQTALGDYVRHRVPAQRRRVLEEHLFGCQGCMRAFIDVREASWALRDAAPLLLAGGFGLAAAGPVVVGAMAASSSGAGGLAALGAVGGGVAVLRDGARHLLLGGSKTAVAVVASAVGLVVVGGVAAALVLGGGGAPAAAEPAPVTPPAAPVGPLAPAPSPSPSVPVATPPAVTPPPVVRQQPAARTAPAPRPAVPAPVDPTPPPPAPADPTPPAPPVVTPEPPTPSPSPTPTPTPPADPPSVPPAEPSPPVTTTTIDVTLPPAICSEGTQLVALLPFGVAASDLLSAWAVSVDGGEPLTAVTAHLDTRGLPSRGVHAWTNVAGLAPGTWVLLNRACEERTVTFTLTEPVPHGAEVTLVPAVAPPTGPQGARAS